jgi:hypothetical protein
MISVRPPPSAAAAAAAVVGGGGSKEGGSRRGSERHVRREGGKKLSCGGEDHPHHWDIVGDAVLVAQCCLIGGSGRRVGRGDMVRG